MSGKKIVAKTEDGAPKGHPEKAPTEPDLFAGMPPHVMVGVDHYRRLGLTDRRIAAEGGPLERDARGNPLKGTDTDMLAAAQVARDRAAAFDAEIAATQPKPSQPAADSKAAAASSRGAIVAIAHYMHYRQAVPTNATDLKTYAQLNDLKFAGKLNRNLSTFLNDVLEELEKPDLAKKSSD